MREATLRSGWRCLLPVALGGLALGWTLTRLRGAVAYDDVAYRAALERMQEA